MTNFWDPNFAHFLSYRNTVMCWQTDKEYRSILHYNIHNFTLYAQVLCIHTTSCYLLIAFVNIVYTTPNVKLFYSFS